MATELVTSMFSYSLRFHRSSRLVARSVCYHFNITEVEVYNFNAVNGKSIMCRTCKSGTSRSAVVAAVVVVCGLMVWTLAFFPSLLFVGSVINKVVFTRFHLQQPELWKQHTIEDDNKVQTLSCQQLPYNRTSSPCYNVLGRQQTLNNITHIYVSQDNEAMIVVLNNLLQFNNVCREVILPLMCLYLFPVCNGSNSTSLCLSSQDCLRVSTEVCREEWHELITRGWGSILPNCATLRENSSCTSSLTSEISKFETESNSSGTTNCGTDFLLINGTCKPRCGRWTTSRGRAMQITLIVLGVLTLFLQMAYFIFSITQWKTLLALPKLFFMVMSANMSAINLMILFNSIYPKVLVCSASDLYENPDSPSLYCSVSGATLIYALFQLSITWLVCNSITLWIFKNPLHARSIQKTHCNKYVHLSLLVLCAVVPIIPVVIIFELGGFAAVGFPPLLCTPRDLEAAYYCTVLPISVISGIGSSILSYLLWIVYKHYTGMPEKTISTQAKPRMVQRRLMMMFCVSLMYRAFFLISLLTSSLGVNNLTPSLNNYFVCGESGRDLEELCEVFKNAAESAINMIAVAFPYLFIVFYPVLILIQAFRKQDVTTCKKFCRLCKTAEDHANNQELPIEQLH